MNWFNSMWIAISTYSILPAPRVEWREENMRSAICFLPVVGICIGLALLLWQRLCLALEAETALFAAVATVLPLLLTGGIHMDGFMDTADALSSHQPRERKLEILKDSHIGAFAVIWCAAYLLLSFGLYGSLYRGTAWIMIGIGFILSRSLCALGALTLPGARNSGMLRAFTEHAKNRGAIAAMGVLSLLGAGTMALLAPGPGICGAIAAVAAFFGYRSMAKKQFGGVTGDTSGFFIQLCELCLLLGAWIGGYL